MNNSLTSGLRQYYKEISALLMCSSSQKKHFISDLDCCIKDYIADNPKCTIEDIKENFGTTEEISRSFMENSNCFYIKKKLNIKKAIIAAIVIALFIWLVFVVISLIDVHQEAYGSLTEGILNIGMVSEGIL